MYTNPANDILDFCWSNTLPKFRLFIPCLLEEFGTYEDITFSLEMSNTRQLPMGAGHRTWGGYTDRIVWPVVFYYNAELPYKIDKIKRCEAYLSMYITYISVSIPILWAVTGPHWQLASILFLNTLQLSQP